MVGKVKATLEFNLPEETEEFKKCADGSIYYSCLWEFDNFLRSEYKYNNVEIASAYRDHLREIIDSKGLSLD